MDHATDNETEPLVINFSYNNDSDENEEELV